MNSIPPSPALLTDSQRRRLVRNAFDREPYFSMGLTAVAVREHRAVYLYAQIREGRARLRTGKSETPPRGFSRFAVYRSGCGWEFYAPFYTRAEERAHRRELKRRESVYRDLAARARAEASDFDAQADRIVAEAA